MSDYKQENPSHSIAPKQATQVSITPERWQRIKEVFGAVWEREPGDRSAFLRKACGGDESLQVEVESLLAEEARTLASTADSVLASDVSPSAAQLSAEPMIGRRIGAYQIVQKIGSGGMAAVYLAIRADNQYRKTVAIKLVSAGFDNEEILRRFRTERQTLATLDHPNIVRLLDGGTTREGVPYLVMDYVEGMPLDHHCDTHKLRIPERLELFRTICEAVEYAHGNGIIHRDLKPSNILVTAPGVPKLLDFGIAKVLNPDFSTGTLQLTNPGIRQLTPAYASPEQVRGEPITYATDVYSLGVVLYELLTGHRPYRMKRHTPSELERAICKTEPEKPSTAVARTETETSVDGTAKPTITPEIVSSTRGTGPDKLRRCLRGDLDSLVLMALRKEPQRRYTSVAEFSDDIARYLQSRPVRARKGSRFYRLSKFGRRHKTPMLAAAVTMVSLAAAIAVGLPNRLSTLFKSTLGVHSQTRHLTDKDSIVVADFVNTTGDPLFDGTLREALAVDLEQSPFLNVLSDRRVSVTLRLMNRSSDTKLTPEVAREICLRTGSTALLTGSVASLGREYLLGLNATNCQTGDLLGAAESQAQSRERVLQALSRVAATLRVKLGESLGSIQQFDKPLEQATTSSLEALQAFSRGQNSQFQQGEPTAIPFLRRAVELDPSFALAHAALGNMYTNMVETDLAIRHISKAYSLRDRVSDRENYYISAAYYTYVTGQAEKAIEQFTLWTTVFPRDIAAHVNLGANYEIVGEYEKAVAETRLGLEIEPNEVVGYINLGQQYLFSGRPDAAKATLDEALRRKLDSPFLRLMLYYTAFFENDRDGMQEQVAWAAHRPAAEDLLMSAQSDTEAYYGRLQTSRDLSWRAVDSARRGDAPESAALWQINLAIREAEFGNSAKARDIARRALELSSGRDIRLLAALALAQAGDIAHAQQLERQLSHEFPLSTTLQRYWLPTIQATIELARGNVKSALNLLKITVPYELGEPTQFQTAPLYPCYLRGQAYLAAHKGIDATREFQKVLSHKNLVLNFVTAPLAQLGLARAYRISGDTAKSRGAYEQLFSEWRDADTGLAALRQAKKEYANLH